jgi:hypothetical protein
VKRLEAVDLIEVDVIGSKPAQGVLTGFDLHVGGVKEVQPRFQAAVPKLTGLLHVGAVHVGEELATAEGHRLKGQDGDLQAATAKESGFNIREKGQTSWVWVFILSATR